MLNFKALIKEAWECAESKGWNTEKDTPDALLVLMHTELSEAIEEYRSGKPLDFMYVNDKLTGEKCKWIEPYLESGHKPEGFPIEIADFLIRVFHFFGKQNLTMIEANDDLIPGAAVTASHGLESIEAELCFLHYCVGMAWATRDWTGWLSSAIHHTMYVCDHTEDIDIEKALTIKMAYNRTRPHRHNGKLI